MVFEFVGLLVGLQRELDLVIQFGDLSGVARDFAGGAGDRRVLSGGLPFERLQLRGELVQGAGELRGGTDHADLGRFGGAGSVGQLPPGAPEGRQLGGQPGGGGFVEGALGLLQLFGLGAGGAGGGAVFAVGRVEVGVADAGDRRDGDARCRADRPRR